MISVHFITLGIVFLYLLLELLAFLALFVFVLNAMEYLTSILPEAEAKVKEGVDGTNHPQLTIISVVTMGGRIIFIKLLLSMSPFDAEASL